MKKTPFDYIDLHCNKFYEMKMRVVRFPISKDSYECIITNLPQDKINSDEIKTAGKQIREITTNKFSAFE